MKIVAEPESSDAEGSLCDVVRMAEVLRDLMVALSERHDWSGVPDGLQSDVENATLLSWQLREMTAALKVEYYAEFERKAAAA